VITGLTLHPLEFGLRELAESVSQMKREPTEEERKYPPCYCLCHRIAATSMYVSITECGLTEAQGFIKPLIAELQAESAEKVRTKITETSALMSPYLL
jgi:hypothetical protein